MSVVLVPKYAKLGEGFSPRDVLRSLEHPGRRTDGRQSAAAWVSDLADRKKIILLCSYCRGKFNPRKHGYRRFYTPDPTSKTDGYVSNGVCDGCKQRTEHGGGGTAFVTDATYDLVCVDPIEQRRRARIRARAAATAWTVIHQATRGASKAARRKD